MFVDRIHDFWLRMKALVRRRELDRDLDDEVRFHLAMREQQLREQGVAAEEAPHAARRQFGNVTGLKETSRELWGFRSLEILWQDIRYGARMLGKSPGLTAIVVLTLALGTGVNTAIFSVLNAWLLRPLPVRAPEQIMVLAAHGQGSSNLSYPALEDFRKQSTALSDLFAYTPGVAGLTIKGQASEFAYSAVTGNYFSALGVKPLLGRFFVPGESERPGGDFLVVLGYACWQARFGGNPGIVGAQILFNEKPATIIGVVPERFHGTFFAFTMDGYLPVAALALDAGASGFWSDRRDRRLTVLGRLTPGVSLRQAQSSVNVIADRLAAENPATEKGLSVRVIPERLARPAPFVTDLVPVVASLFLALPALVLLLAAMNVANILLARAAARQGEIAIRAALGAGRGRLTRQLLTESSLLALLGGLGGLVLGKWAIGASGSMLHSVTTTSSNFGYKVDCALDWRVFAYALAAAVLAGLLVGIWPALRAGRADMSAVLHECGRSDSGGVGRHGIRSVLVVAQVAGSLILLIVAGLFVRSLDRAEHMYLGFDPDHVLNVMLDPHQIGYDETRAKTFYRELESRVRGLPEVRSASLASNVPLGMPSPSGLVYVEGHPLAAGQQPPTIAYDSIDPAYFETMRILLLRGRNFTESDNEMARPVAIVNQTMAKLLWPNEDPIGKRFRGKSATEPFVEVVGLARDGQTMWALSQNSTPYYYLPLTQNFSSALSLQLRSSVPPESLITRVQEEIRKVDPNLPVMDFRTMKQTVHGLAGLFIFRLAASLAGAMGTLGLTLALVGLYGVVSFTVSQRRHEFGIRLALGAERSDILKLALRQGLGLVAAGLIAGLLCAWALTRAMGKLLIGVSATDPVTYAIVVVLLSAVALAASYAPARRATKVDPMVALRYE